MSTLRLNQTVCLVAMAFLHYGRGGNAGFQHADKSIRAIFDQSEHIKLTHVSIYVVHLHCFCLCLFDYLLHFDY